MWASEQNPSDLHLFPVLVVYLLGKKCVATEFKFAEAVAMYNVMMLLKICILDDIIKSFYTLVCLCEQGRFCLPLSGHILQCNFVVVTVYICMHIVRRLIDEYLPKV